MKSSVNSFQSLSTVNGDYKCATFGLERLHKSWPEVSWVNDTPASGKDHFKNAHARFWKCPKLELRHYWHFINSRKMIFSGVPPYVTSDLWMETRTRSRRFPLCAAVRCPQSGGWEGWVRLHLRASLHSKFSASCRHQWEGGTTGRRPLSASQFSWSSQNTDTFGPFRTRHELCGDGKLSVSATISLSSWRFRAQLEEACGAHHGVNATCQVRLVYLDVCVE